MRIEDAIYQKKFRHEYEKLAVNLVYTERYIDHHFVLMLKPYGLTRPQFNVLRILRGQHPNAASVNLLIERMIDPSSNASRIVDKLESKELVTRKACRQDRRRMDVKITQAGLELLKELDVELEKYFGIFNGLDESEARTLNTLLDKLRKGTSGGDKRKN